MWLLCLQKICSSGTITSTTLRNARSRSIDAIKQIKIIDKMMLLLLRISPDLLKHKNLYASLQIAKLNIQIKDIRQLAAYAIFRTICELPVLSRLWWINLERGYKNTLKQFVEERVSSLLISREVSAALEAANKNDAFSDSEMTVRGSVLSREICATYAQEDAKLEMKVKLPPAYPLINAEVELSGRVGFSEVFIIYYIYIIYIYIYCILVFVQLVFVYCIIYAV
jgi:hypothetical protein